MNTPYFTQIANEIIRELEKAEREIFIAVAWFTNPVLFEILKNKRRDGVALEIIISDDAHNFGKLPFEQLVKLGCQVWIKQTKGNALMHNKYCLIDKRTLITGSYNWSIKAESNFENIIVTDDPAAVDRYYGHFQKVLKFGGFREWSNEAAVHERNESAFEIAEDNRLFNLEKDFNDEAEQNIQAGLRAGIKVNLDLLYNMIRRYTAAGAAKRLATFDDGNKIQNGLRQLWERQMLELSFERMILKNQYSELFSDKVKEIARKKLASLNYYPADE